MNTKIFYRYKFPSKPSPRIIKAKVGLTGGWLSVFLQGPSVYTGVGAYSNGTFRKSTEAPELC